MLDEFSYSLEEKCEEKFDFVTVALRDLLKGLGLHNGFRQDPISKSELLEPKNKLTDFEILTNKYLGDGTNSERYEKATSGGLFLSNIGIELYAPQQWDNEKSLKYFIPNSKYKVSQALSHEFGRGCVYRDFNDDYALRIFRDLLNWRADIVTGSASISATSTGTSSDIFPYNGSITFSSNDSTYQTYSILENQFDVSKRIKRNRYSEIYLVEYLDKFHPGLSLSGEITTNLATVAILRVDGTWDIVYETPYNHIDGYNQEITFNMNDFVFHENEGAKYARTCDGYLRTRITLSYDSSNFYGRTKCFKSRYYVMDYTPQQIEIDHQILDDGYEQYAGNSYSSQINVRIGLKNIEGLNKVVLERKVNNARLPVKIEVKNFNDGFFDTTCASFGTTSFVAVGYNENGISRSEQIVIVPPSLSNLSESFFRFTDNKLILDEQIVEAAMYMHYEISQLENAKGHIIRGKVENNFIDVSNLSKGIYILRFIGDSAPTNSIKFIKN